MALKSVTEETTSNTDKAIKVQLIKFWLLYSQLALAMSFLDFCARGFYAVYLADTCFQMGDDCKRKVNSHLDGFRLIGSDR